MPRITVRGVHGWVLPHQVGIRSASSKLVDDPDAIDGRAFTEDALEDRTRKLGRMLTEYAFIDPDVTSPRTAVND